MPVSKWIGKILCKLGFHKALDRGIKDIYERQVFCSRCGLRGLVIPAGTFYGIGGSCLESIWWEVYATK